MKSNLILTFLLFFVHAFSIGQNQVDTSLKARNARQWEMIDKAYDFSYKHKNIDSLQKVLNSGKITNLEYYAGACLSKIDILERKYKKEIKEFRFGDSSKQKYINEILDCYKLAIDTCTKCKLKSKKQRLSFLEDINDRGTLYQNDLNELKAFGYREPYHSLNLGINYMRGINNWLGLEISFFTYSELGFKKLKKNTNSNKYYVPFEYPFVGSFLSVGYMRNLDRKVTDLSFSIIQITSPLLINITKFGFQTNKEDKISYWYYRPEIGFGWSYLSIYYSYNLLFNNSSRHSFEKHLFNLKILFPFY